MTTKKTASPESEGAYDFNNFEKDALTKPRDLAWDNWAKFEKVGDKIQGYIRDVFYRPAEGMFKEQRGITIEQVDGTFINVGIKRLPFVLDKTDKLRLNDPVTVVLAEESPSSTKGFSPTKIFAYYGTNLDANKDQKTVKELEDESMGEGGAVAPESEVDKSFNEMGKAPSESDDIPFD